MKKEEQKFWDFKGAVVGMLPETPEGFLDLEPHHMEVCLQVAALYAALNMDGIDFVAHAIECYRSAEAIVAHPEPALTIMDGGKENDGPRQPC
jgi:hypothetical protein